MRLRTIDPAVRAVKGLPNGAELRDFDDHQKLVRPLRRRLEGPHAPLRSLARPLHDHRLELRRGLLAADCGDVSFIDLLYGRRRRSRSRRGRPYSKSMKLTSPQ